LPRIVEHHFTCWKHLELVAIEKGYQTKDIKLLFPDARSFL